MGKIWRIIPVVTIVVLLFSLIESLTILPAHLAHMKDDDEEEQNRFLAWWSKVQLVIHNGLQSFIKNQYNPLLRLALKNRGNTIAISISILIFTMKSWKSKIR